MFSYLVCVLESKRSPVRPSPRCPKLRQMSFVWKISPISMDSNGGPESKFKKEGRENTHLIFMRPECKEINIMIVPFPFFRGCSQRPDRASNSIVRDKVNGIESNSQRPCRNLFQCRRIILSFIINWRLPFFSSTSTTVTHVYWTDLPLTILKSYLKSVIQTNSFPSES